MSGRVPYRGGEGSSRTTLGNHRQTIECRRSKGFNYSHHLELFHFHYDVAPGEKEGDEWGDETGCTLAHPATWKSESEDFDIKNVLAMSGENGGKNI